MLQAKLLSIMDPERDSLRFYYLGKRYENKIEHFGNPVLRWMLASTLVKTDPAGNIKPDKEKSTQKIDGIVASIMALGEWMTAQADDESNPYENRGLLTL